MAALSAFIEGVGILGPGLAGWETSRDVLAGRSSFTASAFEVPRADVLPAAERRRTGLPVKLAICVGQEALTNAHHSAQNLATVFTSSGADGEVIHAICETLGGPEREISPTRFHNSVHNAPAGYWGIAMRSHAPSTSICCFDWSVAAGLLESMAQLHTDYDRVLLIAFDTPYPEPLNSVRPVSAAFGSALLLARNRTQRAQCLIEVACASGLAPSRMDDAGLESLRSANPSARALPLLAAVAAARDTAIVLEHVCNSQVQVAVRAC